MLVTATDLVHRVVGGWRVLVIESDPDAAATLTAALRLHGLDARAAHSGAAALALATETNPDVIVTDLDLPDADGCAFIRRVRGWPRPPAVIVVSGHTALGRQKAAAAAGAAAYRLKPADPGEIAGIVRQLCAPDPDE
jgi:DNA-binding response OmpR family regulator